MQFRKALSFLGTDVAKDTCANLGVTRVQSLVIPGRLTPTSGEPVQVSDQTGVSTLLWTPWRGNGVPIHDGTGFVIWSVGELSRSLASMTSGGYYDAVLYENGGSIVLDFMPAWTNATTRSSGITKTNGIYVNTSSFTSVRAGHSVSAGRATWVGTIKMTGTSTTEHSEANRYIWNAYNQVPLALYYNAGNTGHNYTSSTVRAYNNDANSKVSLVTGYWSPLAVQAVVWCHKASSGDDARFGLGMNSTTGFSGSNSIKTTSDAYEVSRDVKVSVFGGFDVYATEVVFSGTGSYNFLEITGSIQC